MAIQKKSLVGKSGAATETTTTKAKAPAGTPKIGKLETTRFLSLKKVPGIVTAKGLQRL